MQLSDFITLSEAATEAGVSKRTIQNHMKDGTAPKWERKGREVLFLLKDIHAWKQKHYPDGAKPGRKA
ncbi:MAG: helix-turn-helix domain-containing protein [Planctomycetes bacterium]|nr:helix-turn-helix domain-containing protein [Planctomycetota bacterium]